MSLSHDLRIRRGLTGSGGFSLYCHTCAEQVDRITVGEPSLQWFLERAAEHLGVEVKDDPATMPGYYSGPHSATVVLDRPADSYRGQCMCGDKSPWLRHRESAEEWCRLHLGLVSMK